MRIITNRTDLFSKSGFEKNTINTSRVRLLKILFHHNDSALYSYKIQVPFHHLHTRNTSSFSSITSHFVHSIEPIEYNMRMRNRSTDLSSSCCASDLAHDHPAVICTFFGSLSQFPTHPFVERQSHSGPVIVHIP